MKHLSLLLSILIFVSCQKNKNVTTVSTNSLNSSNGASQAKIAAKINNRTWSSAARISATDTNVYLAAIKYGALQIKTFGNFVDSIGMITQDQLGIYVDGVTDTGVYSLSLSNYIVYNQLLATPLYFSSQISNIGSIHITNLTDSSISGTFNCQVENTSGSGAIAIKEGVFTDIVLQ